MLDSFRHQLANSCESITERWIFQARAYNFPLDDNQTILEFGTMTTKWRATTILAVQRDGKVAIGGDGQVTLGAVVMKSDAHKIRRLYETRVVVGFAGASADAF